MFGRLFYYRKTSKMELTHLMIHVLGTKAGRDYPASTVKKWFRDRGWKHDGYHDLMHLTGLISELQPMDNDNVIEAHEIANGARGWNRTTKHLALVGGAAAMNHKLSTDTKTPEQEEALLTYIKYHILRYPTIKVIGHNQVSSKACPCFNVPQWCLERKISAFNVSFYWDDFDSSIAELNQIKASKLSKEKQSPFDLIY